MQQYLFEKGITMFCHSVWWHVKLQSFICPNFACDSVFSSLEENKCILPCALNQNLPQEFISHQTSDSSTQSNKKLNPATHSWEVKPSLSSDSSGREGWRRCAKRNQASSRQHLTLTDTSSRKDHQQFPLNPEASPLSALLLLMLPGCPGKIWFCGKLTGSFVSNQHLQLIREKSGC